jgi:FtsP/CotA-like multicopper oxidase with cupredoxin domain
VTVSARRAVALVAFAVVVTAASVVAAEPRVIELAIRNGELPTGARVVRVQQGDDVTLRWSTDKALTVHLHGYDVEAKLVAGTPATTRFQAKASGRFPIEVHAPGAGGERTLGYLEVHPR